MKKLVIGGAAVVVLALAGYFGALLWAQSRAEREVAATFEPVRSAGGTATYGKVDFDLWTWTLTVADIAVQPAGGSQTALKVARLVARSVGQPQAGHLSAQRVEISDLEVDTSFSAPAGTQVSYRAPSIAIEAFSGPVAPLRRADSSSAADLTRLAIEHLVASAAVAVDIPSLTATFTPAEGGAFPSVTYVYSDIGIRELRDGRIARATIAKMSFTTTGAEGTGAMSGELETFAAAEIDLGATLALFHPARAKDEGPLRVYRQVTTGPYTTTVGDAMRMRIDGMALKDMGVVPARFSIDGIMALVEAAPPPGSQPSPATARALLDKLASLYEGVTIGSFETRGLSMSTPDGRLNLGTLRLLGLAGGKLAEFAFEGFDAETQRKQPLKVGRFTLKGLDISNLLRVSTELDANGRQPDAEQIAALLRLIEGAEIKDLVATHDGARQPVQVESLILSWGQYAGPLPTRARATAKISGQIDQTDPDPFRMLAAMGFVSTTISLDIGADWAEATGEFTIAPAAIEVASLFALEARIGVGNVSRDVFSLDPVKAVQASAGLEAGPVEITLRDTGGLKLAILQYAEANNLPPSAAQTELVKELNQSASILTQASPELAPVFAAAAKFLETPGGALTVKATPNGRVRLLDFLALAPEEALLVLSRFSIEASVSP